MPESYQNVGQASPAAGATVALLTVPANTFYILSTIQVCNTGTAPTVFRLQFAIAGAASSTPQWLYYDAALGPNVSVSLTLGITAAPGDVIRAYAREAGVSFNAFGTAVTP